MASAIVRGLAGLAALALGAALVLAWLAVEERAPGLRQSVAARLDESGVGNAVTAVLLNFRAIDTLLEIAVLVAALIGVWALRVAGIGNERLVPSPIFDALLHFSAPTLLVLGAYLLWIGAEAPGGAFQAGAVLAGAAILLHLSGRLRLSATTLAVAGTFGLVVFIAAGAVSLALEGGFLDYPDGQAGPWILAIETAATLSIAAILTALFLGNEPGRRSSGS